MRFSSFPPVMVLLLLFTLAVSPAKAVDLTLPDSYPGYTVDVLNSPTPGYMYFRVDAYDDDSGDGAFYPTIMDQDGNIVWFMQSPPETPKINGVYPFPEHKLFMLDPNSEYYLLVDTTYTVVDTLRASGGYTLDWHDFLIEDDGSYWLMVKDPRTIDMSAIIEGGNPEATVIGFGFQHFMRTRISSGNTTPSTTPMNCRSSTSTPPGTIHSRRRSTTSTSIPLTSIRTGIC